MSVPATPSRKRRLKPTQEAFVKHYTDPTDPAFGNGTEAYLQSHPNAHTRTYAALGASRMIRNDKVRQELEGLGWGKDRLAKELQLNLAACWTSCRLDLHQSAIEKLAKLTGLWTDKAEVVYLDEAQQIAIQQAVAQGFKPNGSSSASSAQDKSA